MVAVPGIEIQADAFLTFKKGHHFNPFRIVGTDSRTAEEKAVGPQNFPGAFFRSQIKIPVAFFAGGAEFAELR